MGGTSMATPLTAGAMALIREYLRKEKNLRKPTAALLKAALIAGATRLPGPIAAEVFDHDQGYGRVNLDAILAPPEPLQAAFVEVKPGLRTGDVYTLEIPVQSGRMPLRITLAYSDYPGPSLVNNLNLILNAPDGKRYIGNQSAGASLTLDVKNNVEVVHVVNPLPGAWMLEVIGSNVPQGPQDFALVYTADIGEAPPAGGIQVSTEPGLDIPDNSSAGVTSILTVSETGVVSSVKVDVDIAHTYIGDLKVSLQAPNQTNIVLHNRTGASSDDLVRVYDVQTTPGLAVLNGVPLAGAWRLTVSDHAARDVGQLRRWSLDITLRSDEQIKLEAAPALAIPDNDSAGVTDSIDVNRSGSLRNIEVWVDITHTWIGDLVVELIAPGGGAVALHQRSGSSLDNIIKTYDMSSVPTLGNFIGQDIHGGWALKVTDRAGRDVGKLNRWGLVITL